MSKVKITFSNKLTESDPLVNPVIILGKLENLKQVSYNVIKAKLDPRVSEEVSLNKNRQIVGMEYLFELIYLNFFKIN